MDNLKPNLTLTLTLTLTAGALADRKEPILYAAAGAHYTLVAGARADDVIGWGESLKGQLGPSATDGSSSGGGGSGGLAKVTWTPLAMQSVGPAEARLLSLTAGAQHAGALLTLGLTLTLTLTLTPTLTLTLTLTLTKFQARYSRTAGLRVVRVACSGEVVLMEPSAVGTWQITPSRRRVTEAAWPASFWRIWRAGEIAPWPSTTVTVCMVGVACGARRPPRQ